MIQVFKIFIVLVSLLSSALAIGRQRSDKCQVSVYETCNVIHTDFKLNEKYLPNSYIDIDCQLKDGSIRKHLAKMEEDKKTYRFLNNRIPKTIDFQKSKSLKPGEVRFICPKLRNIYKLN